MKIRKNQIDDMGSLRKEASYRSLAAQLKQSSPNATKAFDDASLLVVIRAAVAKAETYGIVKTDSVTVFVKLAVFAGLSFDEHPSVRQFLTAPELDPDYKINLLAQLVLAKLNTAASEGPA